MTPPIFGNGALCASRVMPQKVARWTSSLEAQEGVSFNQNYAHFWGTYI